VCVVVIYWEGSSTVCAVVIYWERSSTVCTVVIYWERSSTVCAVVIYWERSSTVCAVVKRLDRALCYHYSHWPPPKTLSQQEACPGKRINSIQVSNQCH